MSDISRRFFFKGLTAVAAVPFIPKIVKTKINTYLSLNDITREAVKLFKNSNSFLDRLDSNYE